MPRRLSDTKTNRRLLPVLLFLLLAALFSALFLKKSAPADAPPLPESILGVPVYENLVPPDSEGRPGELRTIRYIVIHETGNPAVGADAAAHAALLSRGGEGKTSWHYTVDDTQICHHIPDQEIAWHAGDGRTKDGGNLCGIGIELCVNRDGDFEKTFENGARLAAYLMLTYHLTPEDIRQHFDFSGKNCPQTIRENDRFDEFIELVCEFRAQLEAQAAAS